MGNAATGDGIDDVFRNVWQMGPLHLLDVIGAEVGTVVERPVHRRQHRRVVVPQDQRPMPAEIVDIFVAVGIPLARPLGAGDIDPIGLQIPRVVGNPARQHALRDARQPLRFRRLLAIAGDDLRIAERPFEHVFDPFRGFGGQAAGLRRRAYAEPADRANRRRRAVSRCKIRLLVTVRLRLSILAPIMICMLTQVAATLDTCHR